MKKMIISVLCICLLSGCAARGMAQNETKNNTNSNNLSTSALETTIPESTTEPVAEAVAGLDSLSAGKVIWDLERLKIIRVRRSPKGFRKPLENTRQSGFLMMKKRLF